VAAAIEEAFEEGCGPGGRGLYPGRTKPAAQFEGALTVIGKVWFTATRRMVAGWPALMGPLSTLMMFSASAMFAAPFPMRVTHRLISAR